MKKIKNFKCIISIAFTFILMFGFTFDLIHCRALDLDDPSTVIDHIKKEEIIYELRKENGENIAVVRKSLNPGPHVLIPQDITHNDEKYKVTVIGKRAFDNNTHIESIVGPISIESVLDDAFIGCDSLRSVSLSGVKSVGNGVFEFCSELESVILNENIEEIGCYAFAYCKTLSHVEFLGKIESIKTAAFRECESLSFIKIPNSVKDIRNRAFVNCKSLSCLEVPESVELIRDSAFSECSNLSHITLKKGLKYLGSKVFSKCSSLSEITIPEGTKVCNDTFSNCPFDQIFISASLKGREAEVFETSSEGEFPRMIWTEEGEKSCFICGQKKHVSWITEIDDVIYSLCDDEKVAVVTGYNHNLNVIPRAVSLQNSITYNGDEYKVVAIADGAFSRCNGLLEITVPEGITTIGASAFYRCKNLGYAATSSSIKTVGRGAFACCHALESVAGLGKVKRIKKYAFWKCYSLEHIEPLLDLEYIGSHAFSGCEELTEITFPEKIERLKKGTFYGCKKLVSINLSEKLKSIKNIEDVVSLGFPINIRLFDDFMESGVGHTPLPVGNADGSVQDFLSSRGFCNSTRIIRLIDCNDDEKETPKDSVFLGCTSLTSVIFKSSDTSKRRFVFGGKYSSESFDTPSKVLADEELDMFKNPENTYVEWKTID